MLNQTDDRNRVVSATVVLPPAYAMRREADPAGLPADDYLVEGEQEPERPPATLRIVQALQIVLVLVLAALSLAIFWLIGLMLNIF